MTENSISKRYKEVKLLCNHLNIVGTIKVMQDFSF